MRAPKLEGQGDESLLSAVVEIALDPPALFVGSRHDAHTGLLHLRQLGAHLRVEARILEREPGGCARGTKQLGLVDEGRVVNERGDRLTLVLEDRDRPAGTILRERQRTTLPVHVLLALRQPEGELERRVAEGAGERAAEVVGRRTLELEHELGNAGSREAGAQHARE